METKLYVGNLSYSVDERKLKEVFSEHGEVTSAAVITDRDTGRSKGFGFIEMSSKEEADAAIAALNSKELEGRSLKVNVARPKTQGGRDNFREGGNFRNRY